MKIWQIGNDLCLEGSILRVPIVAQYNHHFAMKLESLEEETKICKEHWEHVVLKI
jgi:hypothetical protein